MSVLDVLGVMGTCTSACIFVSLVPDLYFVYKVKDTSRVNFYPLLSMLAQCYAWVLYGYVSNFFYPLGTINTFGTFMGIGYVSVYCYYEKERKQRYLRYAGLLLLAMVSLTVFVAFAPIDNDLLQDIIGYIANAGTLILFASPFTELLQVIRDKCSDIIPLWMAITGFADSSTWTLIGIVKMDLFLALPNILPALLCAAQLVLIIIYPRSRIVDVENGDALIKPVSYGTISSDNEGTAADVK